jgi:hypothetical protein
MYIGSTVPTDRPTAATQETFNEYAQRRSWHAEEGAALACGIVPRKGNLSYRPYDDSVEQSSRRTWGHLFADGIGRILTLYERAVRASDWDFLAPYPYVAPVAFIAFCDEVGVRIPPGLRASVERFAKSQQAGPDNENAAVRSTGTEAVSSKRQIRDRKKRRRQTVLEKRKSTCARLAMPVAAKLKDAGVRISITQLQVLVQSNAPLDRTVGESTFQNYVTEWRRGQSKLARLLRVVLWPEAGRPTNNLLIKQKTKIRERLPEYSEILFGDGRPKKLLK